MDIHPILLNEDQLRMHLDQHRIQEQLRCHFFNSISSTQTYLKEKAHTFLPSQIQLCCTETQTKGRRPWTHAH